ncbi:hypothetical protein Tco_0744168 [Tanacetum coccineum]
MKVRNFAAMANLSLRLSVSWRGRQAYASSMPHILSLLLSMACDNGDGHGSQTLIPNVSRTSSFVIMLVGAAVAGQGNDEFIDREEHRGGDMHLGVGSNWQTATNPKKDTQYMTCTELMDEYIKFQNDKSFIVHLGLEKPGKDNAIQATIDVGCLARLGGVLISGSANANQIVRRKMDIWKSDGNEDMVDNRYLKANYPLLVRLSISDTQQKRLRKYGNYQSSE